MSQPNLLRLLVATDIHLGKHEDHPIRGADSFQAFSEVLSIAKATKPDILLLGGDLFDSINPSMKALYACLRGLRDVVFDQSEGDDAIQIVVEGCSPNYLSKNLNVRLPIFSVHGNHDYPQELDGRSVFDLLQQSNYINYIGRYQNTQAVHVQPIIITKGTTQVALYAMGYINTVKLSRLFQRKKITFASPPEGAFNILLIHQNRFKGKRPGADYQQCVHPNKLPKWIDLLIWCHEHESLPAFTVQDDIRIYQPGSTVATSIIEAESAIKHIGMLYIEGKKIKLEPHFLEKSYRPIFCYQFEMAELLERYKQTTLKPEDVLLREITRLLDESLRKESSKNGKLPLVRAKVQRTGFDTLLVKMCERELDKMVANPSEVFKFWRRKVVANRMFHVEISDEQLMDALRNKISLIDPVTEFEVELSNRMAAQLKKINANHLGQYSHTLEEKVVKNVMTEKEGMSFETKQILKIAYEAFLAETSHMQNTLERQYIDCYRIMSQKIAPNLAEEATSTIATFTSQQQEQIMAMKEIAYQDSLQQKLIKDTFQKLYQPNETRKTLQEESSKQLTHQSTAPNFIEIEQDKCCPPANQVYSNTTAENFKMAAQLLSIQAPSRRLKPVPAEPLKKPRKRTKSKKKNDMTDEQS